MAETNLPVLQEKQNQHSAGTVDPEDVQKYGMKRATQIAIQKAEDKARFDSQPKTQVSTTQTTQN